MKFHTVLPPDEILQTGAGLSTQALMESLPLKARGLRRSTSTARLVSHIRQLCVLGVDSYTLMPALADAVTRLVRADLSSFWWAGEDYQPADVYHDRNALKCDTALSRYVTTPEEFAQRSREAHGLDFATAMRRGCGWGNTAQHERSFLSSLEFELMWRPLNIRHGLEQTMVQNGRGWGSFMFARAQNAQPFDARAAAALAPLSPFIAHAIRTPARARSFASEATESGVVVSDRAGRILWHSALGPRLIQQAASQATLFAASAKTLPDWLRPLIARLLHADAQETHAPPIMQRRTRCGEFTLRAYPLLNQDPALRSSTCFAIHIERREPLVLQVTRGAHALGLSRRQAELCARLAEGGTYGDIAQKIGVRPTSVIDQMRKMYTRLDVHERPDLLQRLSAAALAHVGESA